MEKFNVNLLSKWLACSMRNWLPCSHWRSKSSSRVWGWADFASLLWLVVDELDLCKNEKEVLIRFGVEEVWLDFLYLFLSRHRDAMKRVGSTVGIVRSMSSNLGFEHHVHFSGGWRGGIEAGTHHPHHGCIVITSRSIGQSERNKEKNRQNECQQNLTFFLPFTRRCFPSFGTKFVSSLRWARRRIWPLDLRGATRHWT